jgi:hypothetical protein
MNNFTQFGVAAFSVVCALLPNLLDAYFNAPRGSESEQ